MSAPKSSRFRFRLRLRPTGVFHGWAGLVLGLQLQLAAAQSVSFDVPAQPLAQALSQFARQAGLQLTYSSELVQGRQAPALNGSHDVRQGLADRKSTRLNSSH